MNAKNMKEPAAPWRVVDVPYTARLMTVIDGRQRGRSCERRTETPVSYTHLDDVRTLLENHFTGGPSKRLTIADIQKEVENFYKVSHADLVGKKRTRNIIYARQIAIYLCRQMLDLPFNDIGKKFNRDHSTVMYSVTNVEEKMKENRELREELEALRGLINEM